MRLVSHGHDFLGPEQGPWPLIGVIHSTVFFNYIKELVDLD